MAPWGGNRCPSPARSGQKAASVESQFRQQFDQFDNIASAATLLLLTKANTVAARIAAYLDVEPHGAWGMRGMFVWRGVGPARAKRVFASRSNSPKDVIK